MKRRRDHILELAIKEEDNIIPNSNKSMTPGRRNTVHEIPSPQAFETVTTEHKATKPSMRSKRAKSLFFGSQDLEKLAEPPVDSLDECCTSVVQHQENKSVGRARDDLPVISTSSASPHYYIHNMSLPSQEPSNCNSNVKIEPLHPLNENLCFLRSGVKTRGGIRRNTGIQILKTQKVDLHDGKVTLTDLKENTEVIDDIMDEMRNIFEKEDKEEKPNAKEEENNEVIDDIMDESRNIFEKEDKEEKLNAKKEENTEVIDDIVGEMRNIFEKEDKEDKPNAKEEENTEVIDDIMDEMRNIFEKEDKEEKPNAKLPSSNILTEEDLINMLELDDDDIEVGNDHENLIHFPGDDDCLFSDASEDATQLIEDATQVSENNNTDCNETLQLSDDEWKSERDPTIVPLVFDGYEKKLKILPETNEPYDYFKLIATDEFFTMLVTNINNYASKLLSNILDPKSRLRLWKDVTVPELKIFFGILFHMGTIKLNRVTDYWKKHPLFNLPAFAKHMSRNRFLLIMRSLNFEDDLSDNRLSKINSLINYFNQRMGEIYYPSKNLAIDESMVLFRGRLIFRQYLKGKKHPYGIKLYILTDEYGVVMKTIVYAGASDTLVGGANHTEKVVLNLLSDYLNEGFSVYMDNFYNSVNLATKLLTLKTYCSGTLRVNRKNNPKEVVQKKLKRGESIANFNSSGICVMKWKDRRDVLMISSQYGSDMTSVTTRRGETVSKPEVVVKYNKYMGGIDHQDQMLAYYSCEHKTIRWYKKLGVHVFQQMLYNSYTLHNIFSTKKSFYEYRLEVISKLLNIDVEETMRSSVPKNKVHVLQKCARTNDGKKRKILRRRCRQCWVSKKVRKDTSYFCAVCPEQYGFCLKDCFKDYHNY